MKKRWTTEEIEFVKQNYNKMLVSEISENIGRTQKSIRHFAHRHKIKLTDKEMNQRRINVINTVRENSNGMFGEDNPNWKGGVAKDNYRYKKRQMERYPKRVNARKKVYEAIQSGRLVRKPCTICGSPNTQAHHEDYNKPLEVIWLCPKHHREAHNQ